MNAYLPRQSQVHWGFVQRLSDRAINRGKEIQT